MGREGYDANKPQPVNGGAGLSAADRADLTARLFRAVEELDVLRNKAAAGHALSEHARLAGKIEGVHLAISYLREFPDA